MVPLAAGCVTHCGSLLEVGAGKGHDTLAFDRRFLLALVAPAAHPKPRRSPGSALAWRAHDNGGAIAADRDDRGRTGGGSAQLESVDQAPGRKIPIDSLAIADGRLTFAMPALRATYEGRWDPARNIFAGTFTQSGTPLPLDLARGAGTAQPAISGLDGSWETRIERNGAQLRLILRVATSALGTIALLDSPDMMANGLAVSGLAREGQAVRFSVPAGESSFQGNLSADGARMSGRWSRAGYPDSEVIFARRAAGAEAAPRRPQEPHPPFPYRSEEVRIPNVRAPGVTLAGTLTLPPGEGPFPAAILISGSGAQDRDESLMGHKPFAVLADHSAGGIACCAMTTAAPASRPAATRARPLPISRPMRRRPMATCARGRRSTAMRSAISAIAKAGWSAARRRRQSGRRLHGAAGRSGERTSALIERSAARSAGPWA